MKKAGARRRDFGRDDSTPPRRVRLFSDLVPLVEHLTEAAKGGDAAAAAVLVEGAHIMALSVECLFKSSDEAEEMIRKIAAKRLQWPVIASPINEEHGPDWIRDYLGKLRLGAELNFSPRKRDDRTTKRDRIAVAHLMQLATQDGHRFTRSGIKDRNEWKKSEFGKSAKRAIKHGLELYESENWIESKILAPIVARAKAKVEREYRRRSGFERQKAVSVSDRAIRTAFYDEALSLIHGVLGD